MVALVGMEAATFPRIACKRFAKLSVNAALGISESALQQDCLHIELFVFDEVFRCGSCSEKQENSVVHSNDHTIVALQCQRGPWACFS